MKKNLLFIGILLLTLVFSLSKNNVTAASYEPSWSEFCPAQFVNAEYWSADEYKNRRVFYCKPQTKKAKVLRAVTVWPMIDCWLADKLWNVNIQRENRMMSYWINRREVFERELALCRENHKTESECFMQVRQIENDKNAQLQNAYYSQQQANLQAGANLQRAIYAQQLNNNLYNMNNSLNNINTNLMMMQLNRR